MDFWKRMAGFLEVEITSANPEEMLCFLTMRGVEVFRVQRLDDLSVRLKIRRKDYFRMKKVWERRGEKLVILDAKGLFWYKNWIQKRPFLAAGMLLLLLLALMLPTRVLFVRVEGNEAVPANRILEAAEESGIRFGASRREVRSERVKNALLFAVPQLQWAGVNTYGCVAVISVRERTEQTDRKEEREIASIAAARDGYILSATATKGNLLCQPGQGVKEGQILISAYTDCGTVIQAVRAEGEIQAQTSRNLQVCTPKNYRLRGECTDRKRNYSLLLGKKRINLWKGSGISDSSCGRMYKETHITLPGGFRLPVAVCVEEFTAWNTTQGELSSEEAQARLRAFSERYLLRQMIAGTIQTRRETVTSRKGGYVLQGQYGCVEMIGRVYREQIGETNG